MVRSQSILVVGVLTASLLVGGVFFASAQSAGDAPRGNWDTMTSTGEIVLDGESYYSSFRVSATYSGGGTPTATT